MSVSITRCRRPGPAAMNSSQVTTVLPAAAVAGVAVEHDQQAQLRAGRQFVGQFRQSLRRGDEHAHRAVAQDVPDLGRLEQRIHGHEHAARHRRAEDRGHRLGALRQVDGHALLAGEAGSDQGATRTAAASPATCA